MTQDELKALIAKHTPVPRQRTETNLVHRLVNIARALGCTLHRNQVGTYKLQDGRYISSGLGVGSSDLIGYTRVTITPEMVGRTVAVFTAIEAKAATGRARTSQLIFVDTVKKAGGIAQIVKSEAELEITLKEHHARPDERIRPSQSRFSARAVEGATPGGPQAGSVYRG